MAGGMNRKISAASARAHTRKTKQKTSFQLPSGMLKKILLVFFMGFLAWAYQSIQPPPPKTCGSLDGPSITASRIKLTDGRHLAYKEHGVPKDTAKYKIVFVHGFDTCRHDAVVATTLSLEVVEGLGVYIVSFDRPGYGESDPNPNQTVKSLALDVEELADQLGLGSKFYVVGFSIGGQLIWSCLKYIPHRIARNHKLQPNENNVILLAFIHLKRVTHNANRLAGATLIAPVANYWWPSFPANLSKEAYYQQIPQDQWTYRVVHYIPWLTYWWNTQKWFPSSSIAAHSPAVLSRQDVELMPRLSSRKEYMAQVRHQGEYESIHRDAIISFGNWEFDPMDLKNPFPNNEGSVHLWHGDEDRIVPVILQRYIAQRLPWIHYHELRGAGHLFLHADGMSDAIIKALLIGEKENSPP